MCIHISGHHGVEFSSIRAPMCQGRQFLRLSCACTRIIWTYEFICPGASEGTHIRVPHTCLGVSGDTQMFMNMYACTPEWGNVLVPERVSVNTHIHAAREHSYGRYTCLVCKCECTCECAPSTCMVCGHMATFAHLQELCSVCMAGSIHVSAPRTQPGTCLKVHTCLHCTLAWVCGRAHSPPVHALKREPSLASK